MINETIQIGRCRGMKTCRVLAVVSLFSLLFAVTANADDYLYIQPFKARIYAKPAISSEVLGTVDSGYRFATGGKEGNWVKLTYKGKNGFVPAIQTAATPPLGKSAAQSAETSPKLGARARTSSSTAVVAGMKGLTYEDRARVSKVEASNMETLEKVEALKITNAELEKFQSEGGKR